MLNVKLLSNLRKIVMRNIGHIFPHIANRLQEIILSSERLSLLSLGAEFSELCNGD